MRRVRVRPPHSRAIKLLLPAALALLALALTPSSFGIVDLDGVNWTRSPTSTPGAR